MSQSVDSDRYRFVASGASGFVECLPSMLISSEDDALELVGFCGESGTQRLLVHDYNLPAEFFDLHTRLAGNVLLKMSNYRIILAAVISSERVGDGRFSEMVLETNRGREFRVFNNRDDAVKWLTGLL